MPIHGKAPYAAWIAVGAHPLPPRIHSAPPKTLSTFAASCVPVERLLACQAVLRKHEAEIYGQTRHVAPEQNPEARQVLRGHRSPLGKRGVKRL